MLLSKRTFPFFSRQRSQALATRLRACSLLMVEESFMILDDGCVID